MSSKKVTITTVALTDEARAALKSIRQRLGMTQKEIIQRALEWIAQQHQDLQSVVMGHLTEETASGIVSRHLVPPGSATTGLGVVTEAEKSVAREQPPTRKRRRSREVA